MKKDNGYITKQYFEETLEKTFRKYTDEVIEVFRDVTGEMSNKIDQLSGKVDETNHKVDDLTYWKRSTDKRLDNLETFEAETKTVLKKI